MSASTDDCIHLTVEIVREIHLEAISQFGGSDGVREPALLESAIAAPQASFGGKSMYADPPEIAAAYLYYICRNHPFIDGNKRAALGACLVFLDANNLLPDPAAPSKNPDDWEALVLDVAASRIDREQTTTRLRSLLSSHS